MAALTLAAPNRRRQRTRAAPCCAGWNAGRMADAPFTRGISRVQADSATITGVTQPSSANERSSTSPCDR